MVLGMTSMGGGRGSFTFHVQQFLDEDGIDRRTRRRVRHFGDFRFQLLNEHFCLSFAFFLFLSDEFLSNEVIHSIASLLLFAHLLQELRRRWTRSNEFPGIILFV